MLLRAEHSKQKYYRDATRLPNANKHDGFPFDYVSRPLHPRKRWRFFGPGSELSALANILGSFQSHKYEYPSLFTWSKEKRSTLEMCYSIVNVSLKIYTAL
jgi:hypothetical protein